MMVPTPKPAAKPDGGEEEPDEEPSGDELEEARDVVDEQLDALDTATETAEAEAQEDDDFGPPSDDPFDGEDDIEVDLADIDVGDDVAEEDGQFGDMSFGGDLGPSAMADSDDDESSGTDTDATFEEAINEGFARFAVIGLDDGKEKSSLEDEFQEVFEAAQLGHFGNEFAQEYIFVDEDDDIDPAFGFMGAMMLCAVIVLWRRPDGEEIANNARDSAGSVLGGLKDVR